MGERVLIAGAAGFVGHQLEPFVRGMGRDVVCGTRDPAAAARRFPGRSWVHLELDEPASIARAMEGCAAAYYLVHGLRSGRDYPRREEAQAHAFARAARERGVRRVIYLGGVEPRGEVSQHLQSRLRTGAILRAECPLGVELRAAMIIGAESVSWQMVHDLSARLPAMLLPAWTHFRSSPVAIDDVLVALACALDVPLERSAWFDLPGPEIMTHGEMLLRVSTLLGNAPALIPVPLVTPILSSYWVALVTRVDLPVARELVAGLQSDLVPTGPSFWEHLPEHRLLSFDEAVRRAVRDTGETAPPIRGALSRAVGKLRRRLEGLPNPRRTTLSRAADSASGRSARSVLAIGRSAAQSHPTERGLALTTRPTFDPGARNRTRITPHLQCGGSFGYDVGLKEGHMADDKNKRELVRKVSDLVDRRYHGSYEDAFRFYARKGSSDGKVDSTELTQLLADASVGNMFTRSAWVSGIMGSMDKDGDGKISWNEFESVIKK